MKDMRILKMIFWSIAITGTFILLATGCDNEEGYGETDIPEPEAGKVPVIVVGEAMAYNQEASSVVWDKNEKVGLFVLKEGTTECVEPYRNVKYEAISQNISVVQGTLSPLENEDPIYLPADGSKVDIKAYYPYSDNEYIENELYKWDFTAQSSVLKNNFMYADNAFSVSKDNNKQTLRFRPVLSEVVFCLKNAAGVPEVSMEGYRVTVKGMYIRGNFNLLTGLFEDMDVTDKRDIILNPEKEGFITSGRLFPLTSMEGCSVEITLPNMGGRTFTWNFDDVMELKPAIRYIHEVTVYLDKIKVVTTEQSIEGWSTPSDDVSFVAAENLLTSLRDLVTEDIVILDNVNKTPDVQPCTYFNGLDNKKPETGNAVIEKQNNSNMILNDAKSIESGSWWTNYVGVRLPDLSPGVYELSFRSRLKEAAAGKKPQVKAFIYTKGNNLVGIKKTTDSEISAQLTLFEGEDTTSKLYKIVLDYTEENMKSSNMGSADWTPAAAEARTTGSFCIQPWLGSFYFYDFRLTRTDNN